MKKLTFEDKYYWLTKDDFQGFYTIWTRPPKGVYIQGDHYVWVGNDTGIHSYGAGFIADFPEKVFEKLSNIKLVGGPKGIMHIKKINIVEAKEDEEKD